MRRASQCVLLSQQWGDYFCKFDCEAYKQRRRRNWFYQNLSCPSIWIHGIIATAGTSLWRVGRNNRAHEVKCLAGNLVTNWLHVLPSSCFTDSLTLLTILHSKTEDLTMHAQKWHDSSVIQYSLKSWRCHKKATGNHKKANAQNKNLIKLFKSANVWDAHSRIKEYDLKSFLGFSDAKWALPKQGLMSQSTGKGSILYQQIF